MGIVSDSLNSQISSTRASINQYRADITQYRQGIADAQTAIANFEEAYSQMNVLIMETKSVFQGNAADAFEHKLRNYNESVGRLIPLMQKRIKSFERRISEIESQITLCEVWIGILSALLLTVRFNGM